MYLSSLSDQVNIVTSDPYLTIPDLKSCRFGYSLAALDINNDGVDDLIVSAPGRDMKDQLGLEFNEFIHKTYNGRVFIYLSKPGIGIKKGALPDFEIKQRDDSDVLFNLGQNLRVGYCDNDNLLDLIVLSPLSQQGGD